MLILTPSWVPRFPRNPLRGQNKHFTQLYNGLFDLVYFRISIIIIIIFSHNHLQHQKISRRTEKGYFHIMAQDLLLSSAPLAL